jgi:hypothetical protein
VKFQVWINAFDEHDATSACLVWELSPDNEREMIDTGFRLSHEFSAPDKESANEVMAEWVKTQSFKSFEEKQPKKSGILRTCDGHPAWECDENCVERKSGLLPFDEDARKAIEKHRKSGPDCQTSDAAYVSKVEDDNAELIDKVKTIEEKYKSLEKAARLACLAMSRRHGAKAANPQNAYDKIAERYGGAMVEAYYQLRKALGLEE